MNLSSKLPMSGQTVGNRYEGCKILVNFVPDFTTVELMGFIKQQVSTPGLKISEVLTTLVKKPIATRIIKDAGLDPSKDASILKPMEMVKLANLLRSFILSPCGKKGWKEAQVTKGGVSLDEINMEKSNNYLFAVLKLRE